MGVLKLKIQALDPGLITNQFDLGTRFYTFGSCLPDVLRAKSERRKAACSRRVKHRQDEILIPRPKVSYTELQAVVKQRLIERHIQSLALFWL
jgi:hypothetical protein